MNLFSPVTRNTIVSAIESGKPFSLLMADGKSYPVPHSDYISLSPKGTYVTVYDDDEHFFVLPLLTMTGVSSMLEANEGDAESK